MEEDIQCHMLPSQSKLFHFLASRINLIVTLRVSYETKYAEQVHDSHGFATQATSNDHQASS